MRKNFLEKFIYYCNSENFEINKNQIAVNFLRSIIIIGV